MVCYPVPRGVPRNTEGLFAVTRPAPQWRRWGLLGKLLEVMAIGYTFSRFDTPLVVQRASGFETGLVALTARLRGMQFVYSSASVADFQYERLDSRRRNRVLFHLGVRLANTIVVQSCEQVALCESRFGRVPTLIRSVAEPVPLRPRLPGGFLWIGRLLRYKRPFDYLELARAVPEAQFWMVIGRPVKYLTGEEEEFARAAVEISNLKLISPLPRAQLMELVAKAVAIVNTSDFEGMPNTFLEGWARGVPALALFHDPDGVIARETVGCFANGSLERLAASARRLWSERSDQDTLSARCREYVEREHALETVADQWTKALGLNGGGVEQAPPGQLHPDRQSGFQNRA